MSANETASFDPEYEALRSGRAFFELTDWSSVSVTGNDRQSFLHNFCTNDVKRLAPGESCETFFCNVKGKIVGHGVIGCRNEELSIFGRRAQAAKLVEHLDRYIIREDVRLSDNASARGYVFIVSDVIGPNGLIAWNMVGGRTGRVLEVPAGEAKVLGRTLAEQGFLPVGHKAFTAARIEAGFPLFGVDFDEENLPQEVGRDREAISFTKGCYLGQETVARIDALGHVNQKIVGVKFFGGVAPERGIELSREGAKVGRATSTTFSPQLGAPLALAMIRREANSPGMRLHSAAGECEVIALPLQTLSND